MIREVELNGVKYPVSYSLNALAHYARYKEVGLEQLGAILENIDLLDSFHLVYWGLWDGHRLSKKDFTMTIDEIGDSLGEDMGALEKFLEVFVESQKTDEKKQKAVKAKK